MFSINSIIHTANNSIKLLIVDIDYRSNRVAYFDENRKAPQRKKRGGKKNKHSSRVINKPSFTSLDKMSEMLVKHNCTVSRAEFSNGLYIPKTKPVLEQQRMVREHEKRANENYELISPIINDADKRYDYLYTNRSHQHIREISQRTGVKCTQIARLLAQFFSRGGNRNAMYPNYRNCGCNYQHLLVPDAEAIKRGRISKISTYRNRTKEDDANIEAHLRRLGKRKFDNISYQKNYEIFDYNYLSKEIEKITDDGSVTKRRVPLPQSQCISYDQFYHYIKKLEKERIFHWSKNGDKTYLKEFEGRFGRARDGVFGPSFRYEIDATIEDVYLRFPYFQGQFSSGRPVVYKVVCTYSQMVAGLHVAMDGPNWRGVMQALYNAFTSKVDFCAAYGIDITDEMWPCFVTCNELTIDNGIEYPKNNMQQLLLEKIGVDCVNYTAIYSGQAKGSVEGEFSATKKEVIEFMPGYVERIPQKGDRHASRRSIYSYEEFVKILIMEILVSNSSRFKGQLHDAEMSKAGIKSTSLDVWNFGMRQYMNNGRGKIFPKEQILFALLPSGEASTTEHGIKFNGLLYTCDFAAKNGWLTSNKNRPVKKLEIRYFDSSTDYIWYRYENKVHRAQLNSHSEIYKNVTWYDAMHRLEMYRQEENVQNELEREVRFVQKDETKKIREEALSRLSNAEYSNAKSQLKNIKFYNDLQQRLLNTETADLFHDLIGSGVKLPEGRVKINTQHDIQSADFFEMYGE